MPSWSTPITWTFKQIPTFANLNAEVRDKLLFFKTLFDDGANLSLPVASSLTLATGACTPTQNMHSVDTQGGAATDNLNTLTVAGSVRAGHIIGLTAANLSHVVTVKNGIGNLVLKGGDFALNTADRIIWLQLRSTTWYELFRSDQNGILIAAPEIKNYVETVNTATISGGVLALDLSLGCEFSVALNAAITSITFSNYPSASKVTTVTIRFTADGTVRAITWPAAFKWPGASAPTMTGTNNKVDIITARTYDGGTTWYPAIYGQNC